LTVVEPSSEMMILSTSAVSKNILVVGCKLEGPLDVPALQEALPKAVSAFPCLMSTVEQAGGLFGRRLVWTHHPELQPELQVSNLNVSEPSTSILDCAMRQLEPGTSKDWDLFHSVPTEFHLLRESEGKSHFISLIHHAAVDGYSGMLLVQELLECYQEIVTGRRPELPRAGGALSSLKRNLVQGQEMGLRDMLEGVRRAAETSGKKMSLPDGGYDPTTPFQYYVQKWLTEAETEAVRNCVKTRKIAFVDYLVACLNLCVETWNSARNVQTNTIVTWIPVQMRGRFGDMNAPMNSSFLLVMSDSHERRDPWEMVRIIGERRKGQLSNHDDVRAYQTLAKMTRVVSLLPLHARKKLTHFMAQSRGRHILFSYLGVLWPKIKDGRTTGESYLIRLGDLELTDVHLGSCKFATRDPVRLGVLNFRGKLKIIMSVSYHYFTVEEALSFLDLYAETVLEHAARQFPGSS